MSPKHETPNYVERTYVGAAETTRSDEIPVYRKPLLVPVAGALGMIQGATGKHTDGYSGYYWSQEG
jgi:hypothetical protein